MRPPQIQARCLLLAAALSASLYAQNTREAIASLTAEGDYERALKTATAALRMNKMTGADSRDMPFILLYLGRTEIEVGLLKKADEAIREAEAAQTNSDDSWQFAVARERAALALTVHDYRNAVLLASRSLQLGRKAGAFSIRIAYVQSLLAMAHLRLGEIGPAEDAIAGAVKVVGKDPSKNRIYGPRVLYAAALVHAHRGRHDQARELCKRALLSLSRSRTSSRDVSLGLLALAETDLLANDLPAARAAVTQAFDTTKRIFGATHPDIVTCLHLLSQILQREGKPDEARKLAQDARALAATLFGQD